MGKMSTGKAVEIKQSLVTSRPRGSASRKRGKWSTRSASQSELGTAVPEHQPAAGEMSIGPVSEHLEEEGLNAASSQVRSTVGLQWEG